MKKFKKEELLDFGLPYGDDESGVKIISDKIIGNGRWNLRHELIFQLPDQPENEAWQTWYSVGATENQDESPWEYDKEVECRLVKKVEKVVEAWE